MKYWITINNDQTHELELPVDDEISWEDFVKLKQVRALGLPVTDITPESALKQRELAKLIDQEQPEDIDIDLGI